MIERVARAIFTHDYDNTGAAGRSLAHDLARRAIAAMREPTAAMTEAGWADALAENAADTYRSMIDEALK